MAYSMNWRPEQDTAAVAAEPSSSTPAPSFGTGSPRPMGPIPGILPPGRQAVPTTSFPPSTTKFSSSYSMNWKPPDVNTEPVEETSAEGPSEVVPFTQGDNDTSSFRALLTPCPTVKLVGDRAAGCEVDGMICSMEQTRRHDPGWDIRLHPCKQPLNFAQSLSLSRAVVSCLYAVICRQATSQTITLWPPDINEVHRDAYQVIQRLGLLSRTIGPSTILGLYAYLDPTFLSPLAPSLGDKWSCLHSSRIYSGPSTNTIYTRYSPSLSAYIQFEPIKIENAEGVRLSCRKDATAQARYSIDVLIQTSKAIDNLSLENDGDVDKGGLCISIPSAEQGSPAHLEACFVSLCHFVLLDDPRRRQVFITTGDQQLEQTLRKYGVKTAMYLSVPEVPEVVYRLKATDFWKNVDVL